MSKKSKAYKALVEKLDKGRLYTPLKAAQLVKETSSKNFDASVDVAIRLGVDPRKADQLVRGTVSLPNGTGKTVRVVVFAAGEKATEAEAAGADVVGSDDLIARISEGWTDFDVAIATPDQMAKVGRVARVLGPRGLMPNPKVGTVTPNGAEAVKNAKSGQVQYRTDKAGIIHSTIGRASFDVAALQENLAALVEALVRAKPATSKGLYLRKVAVSSTMGVGVKVDTASVSGTGA